MTAENEADEGAARVGVEAAMDGLVNIATVWQTLAAMTVGYRAALVEGGFSEQTAEMMSMHANAYQLAVLYASTGATS